MSDVIFFRVRELIAQNQGIDPSKVRPDTTFEELGMDSLDALSLINELEEEYDVRIPNEVVLQIRTISQAVENLEKVIGS